MKVYRFLSKAKILQTYSLKLLFIAVVGIHIPLIGLSVFLTSHLAANIETREVFLLTFGLTILASGVSLYILNEMMIPVREAKNALQNYLTASKLPNLPIHYKDEVGVLMQSVQQTLESLDSLINEKQDMIALLSHDLRSPVSSIISLSELIKMESNNEAVHEYCNNILTQSEKQLHLIQTVLNLLRQDYTRAHLQPLEKQSLLLSDILNKAEKSLEVDLRRKQILLVRNIPNHFEIYVHPDTFLQVLTNIIHNAIKFSFRNSQIVIYATHQQQQTHISIQDHGIGFENQQDLSGIFNRFTKNRRTGTEGEPTTGIGLYLCKKIVQRHGGEIRAVSQGRNKGSTIQIIIPMQQ